MGKFLGVLWTSTALAAGMAVTVSGCADGSGTILTANLEGRRVGAFDVHENGIAYGWSPVARTTPQHIVLRELSTGKETEIDSGGNYGGVAMDAAIVAYVKRGSGEDPGEIIAYTVSSGARQTIATGRITSFDADAGWAVWVDYEGARGTVKIGRLAGGGGAAIDSAEGIIGHIVPRVGTGHAVWVRKDRAGEHRLMVYDIASGTVTATDVTSSRPFAADVSSGRVVYRIYGEPQPEIHVYDIASRNVHVIAASSRIKDRPRIEGNIVAWTEHIAKEEYREVPSQPLYDEHDFRNLMRHDLSRGTTVELAHNVFGLGGPVPSADGKVYVLAPRALTPADRSNTGEIDIRVY